MQWLSFPFFKVLIGVAFLSSYGDLHCVKGEGLYVVGPLSRLGGKQARHALGQEVGTEATEWQMHLDCLQ